MDLKTSQITPVRGFRALRKIQVETERCLAVQESNIANFVGMFPTSTEAITLDWYKPTPVDGMDRLTDAFLGLVRESKIRLPRLRFMQLSTGDERASVALWNSLASAETAQMNKKLSVRIRGPGGGGENPAWVDSVCICGQKCFVKES